MNITLLKKNKYILTTYQELQYDLDELLKTDPVELLDLLDAEDEMVKVDGGKVPFFLPQNFYDYVELDWPEDELYLVDENKTYELNCERKPVVVGLYEKYDIETFRNKLVVACRDIKISKLI